MRVVTVRVLALALALACIIHSKSVFAQTGYSKVQIKSRVLLDAPLVKQRKMLCGPATIEMLFKYWGVTNYDQIEIARNILKLYPDVKRVQDSGILRDRTIDWGKYPGTGTSVMRKFLRRFASTYNSYMEHLPPSPLERKKSEKHHFDKLKKNLSRGIPVIVHQKSPRLPTRGHYRLAVGYDEKLRIVYLNDASPGIRIEQTYEDFLSDWNVDQRWLHYNALAFNLAKKKLTVKLPH